MKVLSTVLKILAAIATIAGLVYVIATYGDKIVAWAKKLLGCCENLVESEVVEEAPAAEADEAQETNESDDIQASDIAEAAQEEDFAG